tara:strand:- start:475 stop:774 length:300 start_codon:yes stop_codon:yes gene_type:complete
MGDSIKTLPTDQTQISYDHQSIIDNLFQENKNDMSKLFFGLKDTLLVGGLYLLFSIQPVNATLENITKRTGVYLLLIKTLIVMVCYFIIQNIFLAFSGN